MKNNFSFFVFVMCYILFTLNISGQSSSENYIKRIEPLQAVDIATINNSIFSIDKIENTSYFDGFGRVKQQIAVEQTPNKKDVIQHIEYDLFGRQTHQYFGLPSTQMGGDFNENAKSEITQYYQDNFSDQTPFSEVVYDNSPLNRKLKTSSGGDQWKVISISTSDHTIKYDYQTNSGNEVLKIDYNNTSNKYLITSYNASQLIKNIVKNENWKISDGKLNTIETFTDKSGMKIADFNYVTDNGTLKKLSTYFIYDDFGNLTHTFTPKAIDNMWLNNSYSDFGQSHEWAEFVVNPSSVFSGSGLTNLSFESVRGDLWKLSIDMRMKFGDGTRFSPGAELKQGNVIQLPINSGLPNNYLFSVYASGAKVSNLNGVSSLDLNQPFFIGGASPDTRYSRYEYSIKDGYIFVEFKVGTSPFSLPSPFPVAELKGRYEGFISTRVFDNSVIDNLCFQYKYDNYNRQIEQKVPDKDWEYLIYDALDRPILTQDANLRTQDKWLFNKYDVHGRVISTGYYSNSSDREELQNIVNLYIKSNSNNHSNIENKSNTPTDIGGVLLNYTNDAFPYTNIETLTVKYYDNYNFTDSDLPTTPISVFGQTVSIETKSLLTSSWTKTLNENTWSKVYNYYDKNGKLISVYDKNYLGGYTQNNSKLDFRGKIEYSQTKHTRLNIGNQLTIVDRFEYDHVERPTKHFQQINSQDEELISHKKYNELGQLETKEIGGINSENNQLYTDDVNVSIDGNTITKTNSYGWNAGLATRSEFTGDGYVEYEVLQNNKLMMIGLSDINVNADYRTIDYAIYNHSNGYTYIYESGTYKGRYERYNSGDIFNVKREGNIVTYLKNGEVFYTSATSSTGKLIGDISMCSTGAKIRNFKSSSSYTDIVRLHVTKTSDGTQEISKTTGSTGWNAGLATTKSFSGNGKVSYIVSQKNKNMMIGMSTDNTNQNYNTIDYAIYNKAGGTIEIREGGTRRTTIPYVIEYQSNDEFTIERVGSIVFYKKNGITIHESLIPSSGSLIGDISMHSVGAKIYDLKIEASNSGVQSIDYKYNIRGWLTEVNDVNNLGNDLFAYKVNYTSTEGGGLNFSQHNGNASQTIWKNSLNNTKKSYYYEYDELGRLTNSHYRENNTLTAGSGKFETKLIDYDSNGNIEGLKRNNQLGQLIDNLTYSYNAGNKLLRIDDATNNAIGFNNGTTTTSTQDYHYDSNGNLTKDLNKTIESIEYNYLDLVEKVTFSNGNRLELKYNANGSKLQMKTIISGVINTTDYLGGFQYQESQLLFFSNIDGYVTNNNGNYNYVYQFKDLTGSNRLSFSDANSNGSANAGEILSSTDYYPMGLTHHGAFVLASNYNFKFQGKEELLAGGYNMYDFGARMYDSSVGRWFNTDPMNQFSSPYLAMGNNFIMASDPNGEISIPFLGLIFRGLAFVGDFISNVVNGKSDALGTAWENSSNAFNGMVNALQVPVYQDDNTTVSFGLNPFALSLGGSISRKSGDTVFSLSGGYGASGGTFLKAGGGVVVNNHYFVIDGGFGENHYGIGATYKYDGVGLGYHFTSYGDDKGPDGVSNEQNVGGVTLHFNNFSFRLENDFLAFESEDRWRSNAIQLTYKQFSIGTTLYNNNRQEGDEIEMGEHSHAKDKKGEYRYGKWVNGQTYSSPVYFGYSYAGHVERIGYSHPKIQHTLQNMMTHKKGFLGFLPFGQANYFLDYDNFKKGFYIYSGNNSSFSLWGK